MRKLNGYPVTIADGSLKWFQWNEKKINKKNEGSSKNSSDKSPDDLLEDLPDDQTIHQTNFPTIHQTSTMQALKFWSPKVLNWNFRIKAQTEFPSLELSKSPKTLSIGEYSVFNTWHSIQWTSISQRSLIGLALRNNWPVSCTASRTNSSRVATSRDDCWI